MGLRNSRALTRSLSASELLFNFSSKSPVSSEARSLLLLLALLEHVHVSYFHLPHVFCIYSACHERCTRGRASSFSQYRWGSRTTIFILGHWYCRPHHAAGIYGY